MRRTRSRVHGKARVVVGVARGDVVEQPVRISSVSCSTGAKPPVIITPAQVLGAARDTSAAEIAEALSEHVPVESSTVECRAQAIGVTDDGSAGSRSGTRHMSDWVEQKAVRARRSACSCPCRAHQGQDAIPRPAVARAVPRSGNSTSWPGPPWNETIGGTMGSPTLSAATTSRACTLIADGMARFDSNWNADSVRRDDHPVDGDVIDITRLLLRVASETRPLPCRLGRTVTSTELSLIR